jgi:hypothetical protein
MCLVTDSSERGRDAWARVKGRTENELLNLPFKAAYMFRPLFSTRACCIHRRAFGAFRSRAMFEFGVALLCAACATGLSIAFRRQRSLTKRLDRIVLDHNLVADRLLLLTLNRVPAEPIAVPSPGKLADDRPEAETAQTEILRLASPRLVI